MKRVRGQTNEAEHTERVRDERPHGFRREPTPASGRGEPVPELAVVSGPELEIVDAHRAEHGAVRIPDREADLEASPRELQPATDPRLGRRLGVRLRDRRNERRDIPAAQQPDVSLLITLPYRHQVVTARKLYPDPREAITTHRLADACRGCRQRRSGMRAKSASQVTHSQPCSMATAACWRSAMRAPVAPVAR